MSIYAEIGTTPFSPGLTSPLNIFLMLCVELHIKYLLSKLIGQNFVKNVSLCIALCCIVTLLTQKALARRPSSLLLIHQSTSCHISLCFHGVCPNIYYSHLLSHFLEGRKFQEFVQLNSQTLAYFLVSIILVAKLENCWEQP